MSNNPFLIVLGIGNSLRMDDGAGIRVVESLSKDKNLKNLDIEFSYLNTGGLEILDVIDGFERAIIVDAASMADQGLKPGEFYHLTNLHDLTTTERGGISSHGVSVFDVLKYGEIGGYQIPNPIEIYGIQIKETGFVSEDLTPEVARGVNKLVTLLKNRILDMFSPRI
ncbi:MAG: hydrogenase maturation protease [Candidatus Hodarchaeales archaeon]|jgi:hydrogenase maturation protease